MHTKWPTAYWVCGLAAWLTLSASDEATSQATADRLLIGTAMSTSVLRRALCLLGVCAGWLGGSRWLGWLSLATLAGCCGAVLPPACMQEAEAIRGARRLTDVHIQPPVRSG